MKPEQDRPAVLVTRPAAQAGRLIALVKAAGGEPYPFPALEILPPEQPEQAAGELRDALEQADLAIFISTNAVHHGLALVPEPAAWPRCAAVGKQTAKALATHGITDILVPESGFTSEALLALPELRSVAGQRVVIVRGPPGRALLAETLQDRGAEVIQVQAYRRQPPPAPDLALLERWCQGPERYLLVSSNETLENLFLIVPDRLHACLRSARLIGPGPRMRPLAERLGFTRPPRIADNATDEALTRTLRTWLVEHEAAS